MKDLVFVHLGEMPVKHLWKNIRYIKNIFPYSRITVIYSNEVHKQEIINSGASAFFYETSQKDEEILSSILLNSDFRKGFWRYSLERLLALETWHKGQNNDLPFLHIESDILIFENFPLLNLMELGKLSWIQVTETHDVSALLVSPSKVATSWLANSIRHELLLNPNHTDMTVLNSIRTKFPEKIFLLPTINKQTIETLPGIFDGASIGMWLTGRDPRNHLGFIRRQLDFNESIDIASSGTYQLNQRILSFNDGVINRPIYNLHVHSKRLNYFSARNTRILKNDILRTRTPFFKDSFSFVAVTAIVKEYYRRNGLRINKNLMLLLIRRINSNKREN